MHLYRRDVVRLAAGGLVAGLVPLPGIARAAGPVSVPGDLRFSIRRKGSVIGSHRVSFRAAGTGIVAETTVRMKVKLAFITAFRYSHDAEEHWRNDRLHAIRSATDDDGEAFRVAAEATDAGILVSGVEGTTIAPPEAFTSDSLWNRSIMERQTVIDAQDGTVASLRVKESATDRFKVGGELLKATVFDIATPSTTGRIWYDEADRWIGAVFTIRGETLDYRLEA